MSPTPSPMETGQNHIQNKTSQKRTNKEDCMLHRRAAADSTVGKILNRNTKSILHQSLSEIEASDWTAATKLVIKQLTQDYKSLS